MIPFRIDHLNIRHDRDIGEPAEKNASVTDRETHNSEIT